MTLPEIIIQKYITLSSILMKKRIHALGSKVRKKTLKNELKSLAIGQRILDVILKKPKIDFLEKIFKKKTSIVGPMIQDNSSKS